MPFCELMKSPPRRPIDISAAAIAKVLVAVVVVWLWLRLWRLVLLVLVAVFLAVALDPLVTAMSRRRVPRQLAASLLGLGLVGVLAGFFALTGSSLAGQAHVLGDRLLRFEHQTLETLPPAIVRMLPVKAMTPGAGVSMIAGRALDAGRAIAAAILVGALAVVLMIYLLIDGRRTYEWLIAYVPRAHRPRAHATAIAGRRAVIAYVRGNVVTSLLAGAFVFVAMLALHVPAALLLGLLAAVCDFVPVLGFILSAAPGVLLALTVSVPVALVALGLYAFYHFVENYYIGPRVYGSELRLSSLAVLLAFAVGAETAGIVGALVALPFAAMYPVIEEVWLREYLAPDAAGEHREIEQRKEH